jgi:hypothetical protein
MPCGSIFRNQCGQILSTAGVCTAARARRGSSALGRLPGVASAYVNLATARAFVSYHRPRQLVNDGSMVRVVLTRPLGSSQPSWRPRAVMSRKV